MKRTKLFVTVPMCLLAAGICAVLLYAGLKPIPPAIPAAGEAELHFIAVGQGDCTLIRTHDGAVLIDAGTNASETDLLAYLDAHGVDSLDYVVLTHPHEDHIGGADAVLAHVRVGTVILPAVSASDAQTVVYTRLTDRIGADTRLMTVTDETVLSLGDLMLTVMCDGADTGQAHTDGNASETENGGGAGEESGNEISLIVRAAVGETAVLIMGDAEAEAEARLVARYAGTDTLSAAVLRVGHHGSDTSTTSELLDAVDPMLAVISVGAGNGYGHPTGRVLTRLADRGIGILRTDTDGTVILHTNGDEINLIPSKK